MRNTFETQVIEIQSVDVLFPNKLREVTLFIGCPVACPKCRTVVSLSPLGLGFYAISHAALVDLTAWQNDCRPLMRRTTILYPAFPHILFSVSTYVLLRTKVEPGSKFLSRHCQGLQRERFSTISSTMNLSITKWRCVPSGEKAGTVWREGPAC